VVILRLTLPFRLSSNVKCRMTQKESCLSFSIAFSQNFVLNYCNCNFSFYVIKNIFLIIVFSDFLTYINLFSIIFKFVYNFQFFSLFLMVFRFCHLFILCKFYYGFVISVFLFDLNFYSGLIFLFRFLFLFLFLWIFPILINLFPYLISCNFKIFLLYFFIF
jgi:hypothetical protein